jgi:hypothetical protein
MENGPHFPVRSDVRNILNVANAHLVGNVVPNHVNRNIIVPFPRPQVLSPCGPTPNHLQACFDATLSNRADGKRAPVVDISPPNQKRTNGQNSVVTPDKGRDGLHINPRSVHKRVYNGYHLSANLVYSSIDWKWREKQGKSLDLALHESVHDEMNRPKSGAQKKDRLINIQILGSLLWRLMMFIYGTRYLKSRAEALVRAIFQVLAKEYPELFNDILITECRRFLRQNVTQAHKFQRTIDLQPTGGLNYGSIEGIRKGVEELSRCEVGIIPSYSTIARCAR